MEVGNIDRKFLNLLLNGQFKVINNSIKKCVDRKFI